jgi:hypothetical protein
MGSGSMTPELTVEPTCGWAAATVGATTPSRAAQAMTAARADRKIIGALRD